jgi:hypothetical protein
MKKLLIEYYEENSVLLVIVPVAVCACIIFSLFGSDSKYLPKFIFVTGAAVFYLLYVFVRTIFKSHWKI